MTNGMYYTGSWRESCLLTSAALVVENVASKYVVSSVMERLAEAICWSITMSTLILTAGGGDTHTPQSRYI